MERSAVMELFEDFASSSESDKAEDEFEEFSDDDSVLNVLDLLSDGLPTEKQATRNPDETTSTSVKANAIVHIEDIFEDFSASEQEDEAEDDEEDATPKDQESSPSIIDEKHEHHYEAIANGTLPKLPEPVMKAITQVYEEFHKRQSTTNKLIENTNLHAFDDLDHLSDETSPSFSSVDAFFTWSHALTQHLKPTIASLTASDVEKFELLLTVINQSLQCLEGSVWNDQWTKTIQLMMKITTDRASVPVQAISLSTADCNAPPQTKASPPSTKLLTTSTISMDKPLWGRFSPNHMPKQRQIASDANKSASKAPKRPPSRLVVVPIAKRKAKSVRLRVWNDQERELTFRPKINRRYVLNNDRRQRGRFVRRMETDVYARRLRERDNQKKRQQQQEQQNQLPEPPVSLINKHSQQMLQESGLWHETFEKRLQRLLQRSIDQRARVTEEMYGTKAKRMEPSKRQAVCEALYQQGVDKRARDDRRSQEALEAIKRQSRARKMSKRSVAVVQDRVRHEIDMICARVGEKGWETTTRLSFVEFSCALLYFGLVPDLNTPYDGDPAITLLWHTWTVLTSLQRDESSEVWVEKQTLADVLHQVMNIKGTKASTVLPQWMQDNDKIQALLPGFRLHYLGRRRFKMAELLHKNNESKGTTRKKLKPTRPSVTYSLHGKRQTSLDPLAQRTAAVRAKVAKLKRQQEQQAMYECTFHPRIHANKTNEHWKLAFNNTIQTKQTPAFERLYQNAIERQHQTLDRYLQAKMEQEELDKKEMAIRPTIVNGMASHERLTSLQTALASNPLPVNYHRKIEQMREAYDAQMAALDAKEACWRPPAFPKSIDGKTIVIPFDLATEKRFPSRQARPVDTKHPRQRRPRRAEALQKLVRRRQQQQQQVDTMNPNDNGAAHWDVCVDVHLAPGNTQQLYLNLPSKSVDLQAHHQHVLHQIRAFASMHGLNQPQEQRLLASVFETLEQLVDFKL